MNQAKRYSAEEFTILARSIESYAGEPSQMSEALDQASETEAKVMGLVEAIERIKDFANAGKPHAYIADECRQALSKFRGE